MPRIAYLGSAVPLDLERRMLGELGRAPTTPAAPRADRFRARTRS